MPLNFSLMKRDVAALLTEIKTQLTAFTKIWTDFTPNDPGFAYVETALGISQNDAEFTDAMGAECFLSTAQYRGSIVRLAKSRGYEIGLGASSQVTVNLNYPAFNEEILIPKNTRWQINGINFTCLDQIVIQPAQTSQLITLTQGIPYELPKVSNGASFAAYTLPLNIVNLKVTVNGEEWEQVDAWPMAVNPKSYLREENPQGQVVRFGNNINTIKPNNGDALVFSGMLTDGKKGNIEDKNLMVSLLTNLTDGDDNQITGLIKGMTVTSALGGDDLESTESIRINAPKDNAAKRRAVRLEDYIYWASKYPGVTSVTGVGGQTIKRYSEVHLFIFGENPYVVPPDLIENVRAFVQSKAVEGITVIVRAPEIIEMHQTTDIGVRNSIVDASTLSNLARTAISAYFTSLKIGANFRESVQNAIVIATGAKYSTTDFTLESFATSHAGAIKIPIPGNADLTQAQLRKANGDSLLKDENLNVIQQKDLTSLKVGNYLQTAIAGLTPDQTITLKYKSNSDDVLVAYNQKMILKTLEITPDLINDNAN